MMWILRWCFYNHNSLSLVFWLMVLLLIGNNCPTMVVKQGINQTYDWSSTATFPTQWRDPGSEHSDTLWLG
jgi:hypothetical protein